MKGRCSCIASPAISEHCRRILSTKIVERTDGVPLFVEELTKTVVEAGAVRGYASISAVPLSSLPVPATLHASLLGRLDRLGYEGQGCLRRGPATATS
jgi:predicted ATPase